MQFLVRLVEDSPLRDQADEASKRAVEDSLWPSLATRLVSLPAPRHDHFNGWVPAVAVAAVCLAMVLIAGPPKTQATQDGAVTSSADVDAELLDPDQASAPPLTRSDRLPIEAFPVNHGPRPQLSSRPSLEQMFDSGSPPAFVEPFDPFHLRLNPSRVNGPGIYMRIE
jgi:hypothetical protein